MNPALCEGQIEGSVHMGLGYALTEELPCENGMPVTSSLRELGVLCARDMPQTEVILVEEPEPEGPFGAKGVGETATFCVSPAIANAIYDACGVRLTDLPLNAEAVFRALRAKDGRPLADA